MKESVVRGYMSAETYRVASSAIGSNTEDEIDAYVMRELRDISRRSKRGKSD